MKTLAVGAASLVAAGAIVGGVVLATGGSSSSQRTLTLLAETNRTVTLGWTVEPGAQGYRLYRDGTAVSVTFNPQQNQAKFSKAQSYAVIPLLPAQQWVYPPPAPAPGLLVTTTGVDTNDCTPAAPCKSFQRAFTVAQPGQEVRVATGTYAGQSLSGDRGGMVTFTADPGVIVGGQMYIAGTKHLTLDGFTFQSGTFRDIMFDACNDDITVSHATGQRFNIFEGNKNITISDSSWGGYFDPATTADSGIGTTGAAGPTRQCGGVLAAPSSNILIVRTTFHDVFWQHPSWGSAHPDCFEINGYVNGVTIRDSVFQRCGDSFLGLYPDQGDLLNVTVGPTNTFTDLNNTAVTFYGIQQVGSGGNGNACGNVTFTGNTYTPNNPNAGYPYSSLRWSCVVRAGFAPSKISGNSFQKGPPSTECATSRNAPYLTDWTNNTFTLGSPCP